MGFGAVVSGKQMVTITEKKVILGRSTVVTKMPHGGGLNIFNYSVQ